MEAAITTETKGFSWQGPRLLVWPILLVVAIGAVILGASSAAAWAILMHVDAPLIKREWPLLIVKECFMLLLALLGISIARRRLPSADFGVKWPSRKSFIGKAVVWGIVFAAIMLLIDNSARLVHGWAPEPPAHSAVDVAGWLAFELLLVGLCEEMLFRGLLLGILESLSPSRLRFGTSSISTAGVTIAFVFALAHLESFATEAWPVALGQQVYAFALGLVYAWLRERSGSLLAPIVAHSISDFSEDAVACVLAVLLPHAPN